MQVGVFVSEPPRMPYCNTSIKHLILTLAKTCRFGGSALQKPRSLLYRFLLTVIFLIDNV
jgi:hypothetical protein